MKILTLVYLVREKEICLALKKRGFGEGKNIERMQWEEVPKFI